MNDKMYPHWLALALSGLVVLIVVLFAIVPLVSLAFDYHEQKQELVFRLQRAKQVIARKSNIEKNAVHIREKYQQQNYFSTRDTVALASADLQKFIKSAILQAGGELTSTQVLPSRNDTGFNRVTVKVRMSGNIEALRSVLYEIETSVPMMIVDQLDIRPVRGKRNRKTRKIEPSNKLNVNFQIASFMRTGAYEQ